MTPPVSRPRPIAADWPPPPVRPLRRAAEQPAAPFRAAAEPGDDVPPPGAVRLELDPDDRVGFDLDEDAGVPDAPLPRRNSRALRSIGLAVVGVLAIIGAVTVLRFAAAFLLR
jgi:hypothetical protein